jgi:hypothetical protein
MRDLKVYFSPKWFFPPEVVFLSLNGFRHVGGVASCRFFSDHLSEQVVKERPLLVGTRKGRKLRNVCVFVANSVHLKEFLVQIL